MDAAPLPPLEQLFDQAPCGHLVTDAAGRLLLANSTMCGWLRYERGELTGGFTLQDLLSVGGRIFWHTHLAPLLRMQGSIAEVKLEMRRRDGEPLPVIINAVERPWNGATVVHVAAFVAEERHKYERELILQRQRAEALAADNARGQRELETAQAEAEDRAVFAERLVGIVSHDIRNPLSVIHMSTMLLERGGLNDTQRQVVARVSRAVERVRTLIGDLLDFTQAKLGRGLAVHRQPVDLHGAVAATVADLGVAFPGRSIRHERRAEGRCVADGDRIVQAVGNLVGNAMTHGAPDQPVTVRTEHLGDAFTIAVHNHGRAIPADAIPGLFQPMVRGAAERTADGGIGLGLYIVREIVERHGGTISVQSSDAAGTTFIIRIPCA